MLKFGLFSEKKKLGVQKMEYARAFSKKDKSDFYTKEKFEEM